jgi:hypothetical protein
VAGKDAAFVLGNNLESPAVETPVSDLLTVWRLDGAALGSPRGKYTFAYPAGGISQQGSLEILWSEPSRTSPDSVIFLGSRFTTLWTASFDSSVGWSEAKKLYDGSISWSSMKTDDLITVNGEPAIAIPLFSLLDTGVLFLTYSSGQWTVRKIASLNASYTSLAAWHSMLFVAVIGVEQASGLKDRNSIFLLQSPDGGATWSSPIRVTAPGANAYDVKLRIGDDGILHLVWLQPLPNGQQVLRHSSADHSTLAWTTADDLAVAPSFTKPQVVIDPCGRLHTVYVELSGESQDAHIQYAVWDRGWSRPVELFPDLRTNDPSLRRLSDDRIGLVMLAQPISSALSDPIRTLFSELSTSHR